MNKLAKPNLEYALICDDIRQEQGNKISLMGLFDEVLVTKLPTTHPRFCVVIGWKGVPGEYESRMIFVDPQERQLSELGTSKFKLRNEEQLHRHIGIQFNWAIESFGIYKLKITLNGELIRTIPLKVQSVGTKQ